MKKKLIAVLTVLLCVVASLSAESVKHYTNKSKGYDGWVTMEKMGNTAEEELEGYEEEFIAYMEGILGSAFPEVEELDEETQWLISKALSSAKSKKGDVVLLMCTEEEDSAEGTLVLVIVKSGSSNYYWCAFHADEESVSALDELM